VAVLRAKYAHRLPELFEGLFALAQCENPSVRLQAHRELLDRLIGKPLQQVDTVTAKVDVAAGFWNALPCAWRARLCDFPEVGCLGTRSFAAAWLDCPQSLDEAFLTGSPRRRWPTVFPGW
jgi:hypothetical protein